MMFHLVRDVVHNFVRLRRADCERTITVLPVKFQSSFATLIDVFTGICLHATDKRGD